MAASWLAIAIAAPEPSAAPDALLLLLLVLFALLAPPACPVDAPDAMESSVAESELLLLTLPLREAAPLPPLADERCWEGAACSCAAALLLFAVAVAVVCAGAASADASAVVSLSSSPASSRCVRGKKWGDHGLGPSCRCLRCRECTKTLADSKTRPCRHQLQK